MTFIIYGARPKTSCKEFQKLIGLLFFFVCHETLKILNIASKTFILLLNYSPILGEDALDKIKLFTAQSSEAAKDI